jgi:TRAP transporter TAXI family solute receptor
MPRLTGDKTFALWKPSWPRRLLRTGLVLLAVAVLVAAVASFLRRDQPPSSFTIAAGPPGTASYLAAENYRRIAAENEFDLQIVTTEGVAERIGLLQANEAQVAFIPSGAAAGLETDELQTLASVYYEPVWIFYRRALSPERSIDDLQELRGRRIALGPDSISTERLARLLLELNGITEENAEFVDLTRDEAVAGLRDGTLDAAFFVSAATEELIVPLLADPALDVVNLRRADAYTTRYRFLTSLRLPEGVIDLQQNLPAEDKRLLSAVANVVIRHDLHPDLIRLMTIALVETHEPGGLFEQPFEFPNATWADLPVSREYVAYLEQIRSGESRLDNIFPFRIAALIDRVYLFVIPVLLLLIPVLLRGPGVYSSLMRRRLYSWYQLLRDIERRAARMNAEQIAVSEDALDKMERRLEEKFSISRGYLAGYYDLRMHIALVRGKLRERQESMTDDSAAEAGEGESPAPTESLAMPERRALMVETSTHAAEGNE